MHVAQLAERLAVAQKVGGSNPLVHPKDCVTERPGAALQKLRSQSDSDRSLQQGSSLMVRRLTLAQVVAGSIPASPSIVFETRSSTAEQKPLELLVRGSNPLVSSKWVCRPIWIWASL